MPAFDTLQIAKELQTAFTPEQAEALVKAFTRSLTEELATKQDLFELEARLRSETTDLRSEITDVRSEITDVRSEITAVRNEIKDGKVEMIKWTVGAIAFNLLGTAGLMVTLIKTIPH